MFLSGLHHDFAHRWLYPVDKARANEFGRSYEEEKTHAHQEIANEESITEKSALLESTEEDDTNTQEQEQTLTHRIQNGKANEEIQETTVDQEGKESNKKDV